MSLRQLLSWPLIAVVRLYQVVLRPVLPPLCRFYPSCSDYALEALQAHGPARGAWLATRRLCRCHPWNPGGVDLVPPATGTRPDALREADARPSPRHGIPSGHGEVP